MSADNTWIGHAPPPPPPEEEEDEDRTSPGWRPPAEDDRTVSGERPGALTYVGDETDYTVFTADMVEQLRQKLREAEAREASGVRVRPTPEPEFEPELDRFEALEAAIDPLADLEIDVEAPQTLDELDEVLSPLPELEVVLAPNSDSNFYAGFDEDHPDGVFLATYMPVAVGTPIYANVFLPAGFAFRTPAIVEWSREASEDGLPAGIGLKMCALDMRMRQLIRSFVRHRKPMFYVS